MSNIAIQKILQFEYEIKMISKGNNFPHINLNENNLKDICILLHNKISLEEICDYFNWSQLELSKKLEVLLEEDLIKKKPSNKYIPNLMVISLDEGKKLSENLDEFSFKICRLIKSNLKKIKYETNKLKCFDKFSFNELSLFILSNVILDFVQINNVENIFLKSQRTKRNGMNYYLSFQEKYKNITKEALGIYRNMSKYYGNIEFGLYGNKRNGINFHTLNKSTLEKYFGTFNLINENEIKKYLLKELLKKFHNKDYELNKDLISGFNRLGIMNGNQINIPILYKNDFDKLKNIANIIKNDYIKIFQDTRDSLYHTYTTSNYSYEISFEEYFIWWYHLLYSRVTELLIESGIIELPYTENFNYIVS